MGARACIFAAVCALVAAAFLPLGLGSHGAWADEAPVAVSSSAETDGPAAIEADSSAAENSQLAEGSARADGAPFGINGFARNAKGTARAAESVPEGYRFPLADSAQLVAVRTPENVLVYVDAQAASRANLNLGSSEDQAALRAMIEGLDESCSMGGELLRSVDLPWVFTSENELTQGVYTYRFTVAGADGSSYTTVTLAGAAPGAAGGEAARAQGIDLGNGALWCDSAELVPAAEVATVAVSGPLERAEAFFSSIDYRPFWVSLKTSGLALAISFVLGLLAAWRVMGTSSRLKGLLDSVFTIPMVLPPTVCGFLLLMVFGQSTAVGRWLIAHGISLVFTWPAAVIAAIVVSFPLIYRTALGAFEALDARMLDAARTLGWSEGRIFRKLMLPLAWPSIAAGTVLAFARAMGEFGCTLFFAGNYAGITQTIPIAIYFEWIGGNTSVALFWVAVVIAFSFLVVLGINVYTARTQAYRAGGVGARRGIRVGGGSAACRSSRTQAGETEHRDGLEPTGGDALRIDPDALRALLVDGTVSADASEPAPGTKPSSAPNREVR